MLLKKGDKIILKEDFKKHYPELDDLDEFILEEDSFYLPKTRWPRIRINGRVYDADFFTCINSCFVCDSDYELTELMYQSMYLGDEEKKLRHYCSLCSCLTVTTEIVSEDLINSSRSFQWLRKEIFKYIDEKL